MLQLQDSITLMASTCSFELVSVLLDIAPLGLLEIARLAAPFGFRNSLWLLNDFESCFDLYYELIHFLHILIGFVHKFTNDHQTKVYFLAVETRVWLLIIV